MGFYSASLTPFSESTIINTPLTLQTDADNQKGIILQRFSLTQSANLLEFSQSSGEGGALLGSVTPDAKWQGGAGSAALPGLSFSADTDTGIWRSAANTLELVTGGTGRWNVTSAGHLLAVADNTYDIGAVGATRPRSVYVGTTLAVAGVITLADGTGGNPSITFADDTDTGIYSPANGQIGFSADGTGRLSLASTILYPITDNALDLGTASFRFKDINLSGVLNHDGASIGVFNVTPVARATALTQTYSTAERTLGPYTSDVENSAYTGINNLQAGTPYATVADLNALRIAYENTRGFVEDLAQFTNALVDDLQAYGWEQ
jgi:hypothetical protein